MRVSCACARCLVVSSALLLAGVCTGSCGAARLRPASVCPVCGLRGAWSGVWWWCTGARRARTCPAGVCRVSARGAVRGPACGVGVMCVCADGARCCACMQHACATRRPRGTHSPLPPSRTRGAAEWGTLFPRHTLGVPEALQRGGCKAQGCGDDPGAHSVRSRVVWGVCARGPPSPPSLLPSPPQCSRLLSRVVWLWVWVWVGYQPRGVGVRLLPGCLPARSALPRGVLRRGRSVRACVWRAV